ncbi:stromelysin-1-like isoform X1 [Dreissena polymorpha]|uniref:stromelysin-1-like isoform X1 n=1 Tax=Dreissena polymorpha TaxID=45954 RepID=UPI0022643293|nr:stromelysin-1-like isoform X1 [Dreissena polymorpha]
MIELNCKSSLFTCVFFYLMFNCMCSGINRITDDSEIANNNIYINRRSRDQHKSTEGERKYITRRKKLELRWGFDVDEYLEKYGYLRTIPREISNRKIQVHSKLDRKHAIRLYQEFFGLKSTGGLNKKTVKVMKEPRCAFPDQREDDPYSPVRNFHFYRYYPRWRRSILTWRVSKYTKKISPLGLWKTLKKAFNTWSSVTGLRFLYTRQTPDIQIDFEHGNHGDGAGLAFDEKGRVVGHAFGPGTYTISGDIHLDTDEDWTLDVDPKSGVNLLGVAIHEIGHALGLVHSRDPRSVMYPAFVRTNLDLSQEDIENAQILYGPNPEVKDPPLPAKELTTVAPKACEINMDDIELGPDGYTYIFRKSHLTQIDQRGKLVRTPKKVKITDIYKNGPPEVDAVSFLEERKQTYMFYNNTIWRYTNFDLDFGYPKAFKGLPEVPRCATFIRDKYGITRLFLFGVDLFWEWSTVKDVVRAGYPLQTAEYFHGLQKSPEGSLRWKDGYIYFFKKDKVFKVHPNDYSVLNTYPKPMPPEWMLDIC